MKALTPKTIDPKRVPDHVALVAMGGSHVDYTIVASNYGTRFHLADEVWSLNGMCAVIKHDRAFVMDDLRNVLGPIAEKDSNCMAAGVIKMAKEHPGPLYTPRVYDEFPGSIEYPLQQVLECVGQAYFNTTVAYVIAYAMWLRVPKLTLFGCDFNYLDGKKAEEGRGCAEFLLAIARMRGMDIGIAAHSPLLGSNATVKERFYGYSDLEEVTFKDGKVTIKRKADHVDQAVLKIASG